MRGLVIAGCLIALGLHASAQAAPLLASTDWPPYIDSQRADGGDLGARVLPLLQRIAPGAGVAYFPWRRTVLTGLVQAGFIGYYPEYDTPATRTQCLLSLPIGHSPLGFAYRRGDRFDWRELADLRGVLIGTVAGYANEERFDAMVAKGMLQVEPVSADLMNLRKLMAGRVDAIVIDRQVLEHLLTERRDLADQRDRVRFHPRLLQTHTLHVCFRHDSEGERLLAAFDAELRASTQPAGRPHRRLP